MIEPSRALLCCVVVLNIVLAGCQSKSAAPASAPKPRISAVEVFNLRTKCQELTEKWQDEGILGMTGAALTSEVESHYDPITNHCYAKVTVTKNFGYVYDAKFKGNKVPDDYLTVDLRDVQIKKQFLYIAQQNGHRTAMDERKDDSFNANYDAVKAEIDRLMSEE
jgi:hypothetical protein